MIYFKKNDCAKFEVRCCDCRSLLNDARTMNAVVVTDPPFNIGYHYSGYSDKMNEDEYFSMLADIIREFPSVIIHYPEALHKLSIAVGRSPERVVAWVYNSNTARQHRDIAYYSIKPNMGGALQEYKNLNDKRIKERIARGKIGCKMYDWWNVNQVKNVSRAKTEHPCQMPVEIMKNIISTLPNDVTVIDPFLGSGTTGVACGLIGMDFIGCDINQEYCNIARMRIEEAYND